MRRKNYNFRCRIIFFAFAFIFIASASWSRAYAAPMDEIQSCVEEFQKKSGVKNVNVVVYNNGNIDYYGNTDTKSLYQIGSMSKSFTGLGILKLVNEGKIGLDDDISDLLNDLELYYNGSRARVSVEDLLRHTSGFTNSEREYPGADPGMSLMDWVSSISGSDLKFGPGSSYSYANANYNLLGAIIESVSGKSYKEYMEDEILTPLGLENIAVGTPPNDAMICEGTRLGYGMAFDYKIDVSEGRIPAGYLYANIEDMCRYLMIQLGDAQLPEEYKNLTDSTHEYLLYSENQDAYFAGWEYLGDGIIGHSGGTPNYSSRMMFSIEKDIAVCVLANMNAAASVDRLCDDIFAMTCQQAKQGFVPDIWKIFDTVYSGISIACLALLIIAVLFIKKKIPLLIIGAALLVLLVCQIVIMPAIFQSGWQDIALVWAPWSVLGGLIMQVIDIIALSFLAFKKNLIFMDRR